MSDTNFFMKKNYHHGDLKTAVLERALELVQKKGEANFTLRELAKSLKVTHAAVYRHFKSKDDLLSQIAKLGFSELADSFQKELSKNLKSDKSLIRLGERYIEFAQKNPGYYHCMFPQDPGQKKLRHKVKPSTQSAAFLILHKTIQEGVTNRTFRKMDALLATKSIWSGVHGFSLLTLDRQVSSSLKSAHLEFLVRNLLR